MQRLQTVNLLHEVLGVLRANDKTPADVRWVGSSSGAFALGWGDFTRLADREYDPGYGHCMVAPDLVVVGDDWWVERKEYAGREWWEFKTPPRLQAGRPFTRLFIEEADRGLTTPKLADLNPPVVD